MCGTTIRERLLSDAPAGSRPAVSGACPGRPDATQGAMLNASADHAVPLTAHVQACIAVTAAPRNLDR